MALTVHIIRSFAHDGRLEELTRICHFPVLPTLGMLVAFADGSESVVARAHVRIQPWGLGVHPVLVEVQMITEPGNRWKAAVDGGWSHTEWSE
jgi:hypothetical protein